MWRFYTRGWGPRAWWHWFNDYGWPMFVAWKLPRKVAYWAFMRVYGHRGIGPGSEFKAVLDAWEAGAAGRYQPLEHAEGSLGPEPSVAQGSGCEYVGPPYISGLGYLHNQTRTPSPLDMADPRFDILWNRLKHLDITGNDIATLLDELDAAPTLGV